MNLRSVLNNYLDEEELRNILRGDEMSESITKGALVDRVSTMVLRAEGNGDHESKRRSLRRIYDSMRTSTVKALLVDEGIPPTGTQSELFELMLFCIDEGDNEDR